MNTRTLGTIAMILSPALLIEALTFTNGENHLVTGICSFFFMLGWLCSNLAMQQMQAIGTGLAAKIVLWIQFVGIFLAMFFGIFEATQIVSEESLLFTIADLCWPLSMVFMIVVGIMAIRAKRWAGWQRFIPLICALWLPASILVMMPFGENAAVENVAAVFGFGWTAIAWFTLARIIRSNATLVTDKTTTAGNIDNESMVSVS